MAGTRSYGAGNFVFNLDGVVCGFVKSISGGDVTAEVVEEPRRGTAFTKKHIGRPKYEDITLAVGFDLDQSFYDWLGFSWDGKYMRKDGSIVIVDPNMQAKSERQFYNGLITEIGFPALDASSKDASYLNVSYSPEYTREAKASGKVTAVKPAAQKQFHPSNFRLELDGVDCSKVTKIDSFTVKQARPKDDIGDLRDTRKEPGKVEFPNLKVTIAEAGSATWFDWLEDFVVKGNNDDAHEKSGAIAFLSPNLKEELGRVILHNVGIFALRRPATTQASEKIARVVAELYCERMELRIGKTPR